jgi:4'-phosphopantetheinyl transferase
VKLDYVAPPRRWSLRLGEIHVCSVPLVAPDACLATLREYLTSEEREQAGRFRTAALQDAYTIARGTLRAIVGRCLDMAPADVSLDYGEHGKPRIGSGHALKFNLSHSGGRALYAVSVDRELGVDLEEIRPMDDCEPIASRYFNEREIRDLLSLPARHRGAAFYTCWTRKEAYIKAVGEGLSHALDGFRVSLRPSEPPLLETPADTRVWSLFDVSPEPGYAGALVAEGNAPDLRAWVFNDAGACAGYFQ